MSQVGKIAVSIATALALTVGGVFAASAQPSGTKDWMVIGLDAVDTEKGYNLSWLILVPPWWVEDGVDEGFDVVG